MEVPAGLLAGAIRRRTMQTLSSPVSTAVPPRSSSSATSQSSANILLPRLPDVRGKSSKFGKAHKKPIRARFDLDGNQLPVSCRLKAQKVSQVTLNRYLKQIREFELWAKHKKLSTSPQHLDMTVTRYVA